MAARLFVAHGARVVMADIQDELGLPLSEEIGDGAEYIHCDVSREEDIAAVAEKAYSLEGHLDIYYNSAGILGALGSIDQLKVNEYDKTLTVNLRGTVLGVKHATRFMKPARKGSIICTGSIASVIGGCSPHAYCISKTALTGLIRSAAVELRDFGVRINMISPDAVATSFVKYALESTTNSPVSLEETRQFVSDFSVFENRALTALDVAQAAVFLASDESGFISGHNLMLDGSSTVTRPGRHNWFDAYSPMVREGGERGLD
ncbi:hypothetical protein O6H91_01G079200 [Diphasiastrum complanatum]|nr:hypothetical protein O6H91_01G079200 [Diphasiastrum complanatum]